MLWLFGEYFCVFGGWGDKITLPIEEANSWEMRLCSLV